MRRPITQRGDPLLRQRSAPASSLRSSELSELWTDLEDTLHGIMEAHAFTKSAGISAVQVGVPVRLAIIWIPGGDFLYIADPRIVVSSASMTTEFEGCLSFFDLRGRVSRPERIAMEYQDRDGMQVAVELAGWGARIALHEIDHMDGILYTDRMADNETTLSYHEYLLLPRSTM